ncbi:TPA: hypothetical protein EYP13_02365 [Candidatus Micrarchaeota archaeon]|nr:hypothetical protein [Candidatus Micrarchaeota archaeon]
MVKISKDINESSERNKKSNYDKKDVDLKNNDLAKELMGYLDNDPNLDASLMKMNLQANLDHNLSSQKQS